MLILEVKVVLIRPYSSSFYIRLFFAFLLCSVVLPCA